MKRNLLLVLPFLLFAFTVKAQCPAISCPSNITVSTDPSSCNAVVLFTAPQGTDPCANGNVAFTHCGATGRFGPTQMQVDAEYFSTSLDNQVTINMQGIQEWTVPFTGVYTIEAAGAQGGFSNETSTAGGLGAKIEATINLTQGEILRILVGQQGESSNRLAGGAGGGGGASFIALLDSTPLLIVAGGGGATGSGGNGVAGNPGSSTLTTSSTPGSSPSGSNSGGNGGSFDQSSLGTEQYGGSCGGWLYWLEARGKSFLDGGEGGSVNPALCNDQNTPRQGVGGFGAGGAGSNTAGGGGGGYSGGSGAASSSAASSGGMSFNAGSTISAITGANTGNGYVNISWTGTVVTTTQTAGLTSGSTFPIGTTVNTYEATDTFGTTVSCSFNITVEDNEAPVADTITLADVESECEVASLMPPTATDNCAAQVQGTHNAIFPISSSTTVTWTYDDGNGNTIIQTQNVIITGLDVSVSVSGVTLAADKDDVGVSYQWINCDTGQPVSGATDQSFSPVANGNYAVIISEGNCTDTSSCYPVTTIGIYENESSAKVTVYPNPTGGSLTINLGKTMPEAQIQIHDIQGRIVAVKSVKNESEVYMNIDQAPGVYILYILSENENSVLRLLKTK